MGEYLNPTEPDFDIESKIATPEIVEDILRGALETAMMMGLTPEATGRIFSQMTTKTAEGLSYSWSHGRLAYPELVKAFGRLLQANHSATP